MVHPDIVGVFCGVLDADLPMNSFMIELTNANGVTIVGKNFLDAQVTNDNVGRLLDKTETSQYIDTGRMKPKTYMPKPSRIAFESLPMMLVLLPTRA